MAHADSVKLLLKEVALEGAVIISKRKLLFMLGWSQDRPGAWAGLLELWEENGEDRSTLMGAEVADKIILTVTPVSKFAKHQKVTEWAPKIAAEA